MTSTPNEYKLIREASTLIAPGLIGILSGFPADVQIDALLKLSTAMACMAVSVRRRQHPTSEGFYEQSARLANSVLVDIVQGEVKG